MSLEDLTRQELDDTLAAVGVQAGDGLLVHSALQFLGRPEGGLQMYLDALLDEVGPEGTLAVPAFTFAFARGKDFDRRESTSENMGVFSEFVRLHPEALRTSHPMQSLSLIGAHAEDLAALDTPSAFDEGSAFDRMLELDFKLLLLGADIQAASIAHYSEQRAEVPYRFWKDFAGRVRVDDGWQDGSYRMYVRDMEIDPQLNLRPIRQALQIRGQWHTQPLRHGHVSLCSLRDFVAATDDLLAQDPWTLVAGRKRPTSS